MSDTSTRSDTYNSSDIQRVYASFAADYKMVAEWTELHSREYVQETTEQIRKLVENEYVNEIHLQKMTSSGKIPDAVIYRISTNASTWSADRPATLKWNVTAGDSLRIVVFFSKKWGALSPEKKIQFSKEHLPNWTEISFDGKYDGLSEVGSAKYSSRGYGMERTQVSSP